jgi:hypothetical protein
MMDRVKQVLESYARLYDFPQGKDVRDAFLAVLAKLENK